jgi:hypothetical protein
MGVDLCERTKNFALGVVRLFAKLPKTTEAQVIGRQLLRCGTSVGANYREACRGRSRAERSDWGERHRRKSREVAESETGDERINSLPNAAIAFAKLKRRRIGSSYSSEPTLFPRRNLRLCARNAMNSPLFSSLSSNSRKQLQNNWSLALPRSHH